MYLSTTEKYDFFFLYLIIVINNKLENNNSLFLCVVRLREDKISI